MKSEWIKCSERMPEPTIPVIAFVQTMNNGKKWSRRIRAQYAAPRTLPQADEALEDGDYDETTDTYYCKEGWYESNEYEEIHWMVSDPVTHWMPLPEPPTEEPNV